MQPKTMLTSLLVAATLAPLALGANAQGGYGSAIPLQTGPTFLDNGFPWFYGGPTYISPSGIYQPDYLPYNDFGDSWNTYLNDVGAYPIGIDPVTGIDRANPNNSANRNADNGQNNGSDVQNANTIPTPNAPSRAAAPLTVRRVRGNRILVGYTGDTSNVSSITFTVLNRSGRVLKARTVTANPPSAFFTRTRGMAYTRALVRYPNGDATNFTRPLQ